MRIKANALFIVIILSLVMGLICSSLVFLAYYSRKQIADNFIREKLINNVESGLNILFANTDDYYATPQAIDLYDHGTDSVVMVKKNWGIFEVANVKAMFKNRTCFQSAMLGYKPDKIGNAAIWLTDNNKILFVGGNTSITGDCFLLERSNPIDRAPNKPFFSKMPDPATIKTSERIIPPLNENIKSQIIQSLEGNFTDVKKIDYQEAFKDSSVISNGFSHQTLVLANQQNSFSISEKISGNIIISTQGNIIIKANAILNDIQIYANSIIVESGFSGTLQLFANDSIILNKDVKLRYPSAACLIKNDIMVIQPYIRLETGSNMAGFVVLDQSVQDTKKTMFEIKKDAILQGQAYVNGYANIQGKIYGNIICEMFTYENNDNYLIDAEINRTKLSKAFVGSAIINSTQKKDVVKWLHINE